MLFLLQPDHYEPQDLPNHRQIAFKSIKQYKSVFYENTVGLRSLSVMFMDFGQSTEKRKGFEIKYDWMVFL
jgi:hypothetical protein